MNTAIEIRVSVFPNKGVEVLFDQKLEVSLDCSRCGRGNRTVIFDLPDQLGYCTPTGHTFDGQVGAMHVTTKDNGGQREEECLFRLDYTYIPVRDPKYPHWISSRLPTWGRVHFRVKCPKCKDVSPWSIQTNLVRPWPRICKCGYKLYDDETIFPHFEDKTESVVEGS